MSATDDDLTRPVATRPDRALVVSALQALQWARPAAWLLELHEDERRAKIWLDRAEQYTELLPSIEHLAAELERVEELAALWRARDRGDELSPRVAAIDAVRRAFHAAMDALEGKAAAQEDGVRETIAMMLRAHRLYAGDASTGMRGMLDGASRMLAPLLVRATVERSPRG